MFSTREYPYLQWNSQSCQSQFSLFYSSKTKRSLFFGFFQEEFSFHSSHLQIEMVFIFSLFILT